MQCTYKFKVKAHSNSHCCSEKAIIMSHYECVSESVSCPVTPCVVCLAP